MGGRRWIRTRAAGLGVAAAVASAAAESIWMSGDRLVVGFDDTVIRLEAAGG